MSKRAEIAALKAFPPKFTSPKRYAKRVQSEKVDTHATIRRFYKDGYEQGEKETIDRAAEWFRAHWREYIWGPDADGCIGFGLWGNDFRKAMEEE